MKWNLIAMYTKNMEVIDKDVLVCDVVNKRISCLSYQERPYYGVIPGDVKIEVMDKIVLIHNGTVSHTDRVNIVCFYEWGDDFVLDIVPSLFCIHKGGTSKFLKSVYIDKAYTDLPNWNRSDASDEEEFREFWFDHLWELEDELDEEIEPEDIFTLDQIIFDNKEVNITIETK